MKKPKIAGCYAISIEFSGHKNSKQKINRIVSFLNHGGLKKPKRFDSTVIVNEVSFTKFVPKNE